MRSTRQPSCLHRRPGQSLLRSLQLAIISLGVVGIAFGIYQLGVEPPERQELATTEVPQEILKAFETDSKSSTLGGRQTLTFKDIPVTVVKKPGITLYEEVTHRKRMHMRFDNPRQLDDTGRLFEISNPIITYYMKRGQRAVVRADRALITSREIGTIDPQRGEFIGQVRIVIDRRTDEWRAENPELAKRPPPANQVSRIWMDRLEFDLDLGRLEIPGEVRIEADEMLLEGRGLTVRWSEATGRVELLTLAEGRQLVIQGSLGFGDSLSEEKPAEASEDAAARTVAAGSPAEHNAGQATRLAADSPSQAAPAGRIAEETDDDVLIVDLRDKDPAASRKAVSYLIEFGDNVVAQESGGSKGRLLAEHLEILFDMPGSSSGRQEGDRDGGAAVSAGAAKGASPEENARRRHTTITWEGPLEIRAVGEVEDTQAKLRRHITATGSPVILEDDSSRATAAKFTHHRETQYTELRGSAEFPATIDEEGGASFSARERIVWDMSRLQAHLRGDVRVTMDDAILQGQAIDAYFRRPGTAGGSGSRQNLLERLECRQDVVFETADEHLTCRQMTVWLVPDDSGKPIPSAALAIGDVNIVQGQRTFFAREQMKLAFGDLPTDAAGNAIGRTPNIKSLNADGEVHIVDPIRGWDIEGQMLRCEFDDEQAITYGYIEGLPGEYAKVKMGEYYIEGSNVTFDDTRQWAHVPGAGMARFVLAEDLDGRRTGKPVPVEVRWDKEMTLRGLDDVLVFEGNVEARSENNTLTGNFLRVLLTDVEVVPEPQLASADPAGMWFLRPFKPEVQQIGRLAGRKPKRRNSAPRQFRKRARYVLADGNAKLISKSFSDVDQRLESRLTLEAPQIALDLDSRVMVVEHAGRLGIEDYPRPADSSAVGGSSRGSGLFSGLRTDGPSQTLIRWDSVMRYYFTQRVAQFESKDQPVLLRHLSGSNILMDASLKRALQISDEQIARLRASGTGRTTDLHCRQLLVEFNRSLSRRGRGGGEMSIGELRQFQASGNVVLDDSEWQVNGRRLDYIADSQLISVYGPRGQNAHVNFVDPRSGRYVEVNCPELHVELKTGYVDAPGCRVSATGR